eukprot:2190750-Prymnesium_polylepis.1
MRIHEAIAEAGDYCRHHVAMHSRRQHDATRASRDERALTAQCESQRRACLDGPPQRCLEDIHVAVCSMLIYLRRALRAVMALPVLLVELARCSVALEALDEAQHCLEGHCPRVPLTIPYSCITWGFPYGMAPLSRSP